MISIVIPLYNKRDHIRTAIESVLMQTDQSYELIIVDDGSTDGSFTMVENIIDSRVRVHRKSNGGPSSARNAGVKIANGDWILFLDADDYLEQGAIAHFVKLIEDMPTCNFFCCNHYILAGENKYLFSKKYTNGYLLNNFFSWCSHQCMPRAGAALFRKSLLEKHPFKESLRRYEDAESLFEIMRCERLYRSKIPVMTYNCNNAEASHPCKDISEDFIGHLEPRGKGFWEKYALFQLYCQGLKLYPKDMERLYGRDLFKGWNYSLAARIIGKLQQYHVV